MNRGNDSRRYPREDINLSSSSSFLVSGITGTILDISRGGVFFETEVALLDGQYLIKEDILDALNIGEEISVRIGDHDQVAYIRWKGKKNGVPGIGLQYKIPVPWRYELRHGTGGIKKGRNALF